MKIENRKSRHLRKTNEPSWYTRSSAHRKRIDHTGLKRSATLGIENYLDHPVLGSGAARTSRNAYTILVLGEMPSRQQRIPARGKNISYQPGLGSAVLKQMTISFFFFFCGNPFRNYVVWIY
ncbi:hypothetical protein TNCV_1008321 [Trichonephila clavipes]|nr:hypothetical protein TNCV_1008321 [Trichonephila clavipes]